MGFSFSQLAHSIGLRLWFRCRAAILTWPDRRSWLVAVGLLALHGIVYLPIGFATGFLKLEPRLSFLTVIGVGLVAFFRTALLEELVFRVLPIAHTTEAATLRQRWFWSILSWLVFIVYHPVNIAPPACFSSPIFLTGAGLVGLVCTLAYQFSGSLWPPVFIHGSIVTLWLLLLGGLAKLQA